MTTKKGTTLLDTLLLIAVVAERLWLLTRIIVSKWKSNTFFKKRTSGHDCPSHALVIPHAHLFLPLP